MQNLQQKKLVNLCECFATIALHRLPADGQPHANPTASELSCCRNREVYPVVICAPCIAPYRVKSPYGKVMMIKLPSRGHCALGAIRGDSIAKRGLVSH